MNRFGSCGTPDLNLLARNGLEVEFNKERTVLTSKFELPQIKFIQSNSLVGDDSVIATVNTAKWS